MSALPPIGVTVGMSASTPVAAAQTQYALSAGQTRKLGQAGVAAYSCHSKSQFARQYHLQLRDQSPNLEFTNGDVEEPLPPPLLAEFGQIDRLAGEG